MRVMTYQEVCIYTVTKVDLVDRGTTKILPFKRHQTMRTSNQVIVDFKETTINKQTTTSRCCV